MNNIVFHNEKPKHFKVILSNIVLKEVDSFHERS